MTLCLREDIVYTHFLTIHNVTTTIINHNTWIMESHLTTLTNQHPTIDTVTPATTITAAANDTIAH
eukprot:scaffold328561_cov166-Cyclotella_meneghiniana.AAC.1